MQARTGARAAETAALLDEFGIELSARGLVVTDFAKAESAYIHYSRVPVAVVAMALASPTFARGWFPKLRLIDVVAKAPVMDGAEKRALAAMCGASLEGLPEGSGRAAFATHLLDVIARYELDAFFTREPDLAVNGIDVRPRGIDRRTDPDAVDPKAMTEWRRAFKALTAVRQMMVATILCLYRGEADKLWLARLPSARHAADAVAALNDDGRCAIGAGWLRCIPDGKPPGSARRIGHDQQRG
jgi:hypothetical protein